MNSTDKENKGVPSINIENEALFSERLRRMGRKAFAKLFSPKGWTAIFGVISFVLVSLVLSFDYLAVEKTIDAGGISKKTFYAPYAIEVVDDEATSRLIERARLKVDASPVYLPRNEFNQKIKDNLTVLIDDLNPLISSDKKQEKNTQKKSPKKLLEEKQDAFSRIGALSENPKADLVFKRLIKKKISNDNWDKIKETTEYVVVEKVLKRGLTQEEYFEEREAIIKTAMPSSLSRKYSEVVEVLAFSVLIPTQVIDEKEMARLKNEAESNVLPMIRKYKKGEIISEKGRRVTPVAENALETIGKSVKGVNSVACLGVILLTFFFIIAVWSYLGSYENGRFFLPSYSGMIMTLSVSFIFIFVLTRRLTLISQIDTFHLSPYIFPLAAFALSVSILTHPRVGMLVTTLVVFLLAMTLKTDFYTLAVLLFGSLMGVFVLNRKLNISDRGQLMWAGVFVALTNMVLIVAIHLILEPAGSFVDNWIHLMTNLVSGAIGGLLSAVLTIGILPFLESVFRLVSPYTLLELANSDKPLLKRMQFEAPGTYHHSLMVASLSENAAEAIGANVLLTRVGSLYHDIGKTKRPLFFIENQAYFGADNPHDKLTPRLSKMVITAHPRDSLEMARQHRLPEALRDFMTEHHGTLAVGYFYNQACIQEGAENVNKSQFRYPGPKPQSKETAIVMLADACESAVRALKSPNVTQIEERIDKIIQVRVDDGQFENCPITFKDITLIKETFVRVLRGIQHNRIEYQQTMMKELGKKVPEPVAPNLSQLQKASQLKVVGGADKKSKKQPKAEPNPEAKIKKDPRNDLE